MEQNIDIPTEQSNFFPVLFKLAIPITVQYFITDFARFLDLMMIGQLHETAIAGMGLANQIYFLMDAMIFGLASGSSIVSSHYWGVKDIKGVQRVLGSCISIAILISFIFGGVSIFFPHFVLSLYTSDPAVIEDGSKYLKIIGFAFFPMAITGSFAFILRSTHNPKLPMFVNAVALGIDMLLNYGLIYGHYGFPALGLQGSALGSAIARALECVALISLAYLIHTPVAARLKDLFFFDRSFFARYINVTLPVILNELAWSFGTTLYRVAYARINTEAIAAINITTTIEDLVFVPFVGLGLAGSVLVGNHVGSGNRDMAIHYAKNLIKVGIIGAVCMGICVFIIAPNIAGFYNLSPSTAGYLTIILRIFGFGFWIRTANLVLFVGIIRAGGDTRFSFQTELSTMWFIGVPLAFIGALWLKLPVYWVYCLVLSEEAIKSVIVFRRFLSKRWIHDIIHTSA